MFPVQHSKQPEIKTFLCACMAVFYEDATWPGTLACVNSKCKGLQTSNYVCTKDCPYSSLKICILIVFWGGTQI